MGFFKDDFALKNNLVSDLIIARPKYVIKAKSIVLRLEIIRQIIFLTFAHVEGNTLSKDHMMA